MPGSSIRASRRLGVLAVIVALAACRTNPPRRLIDETGLIAVPDQQQFETYLSSVFAESGIDCRFLLVQAAGNGGLEQFAVQRARALGLGRESDRRGVLFVYDLAQRRLRIEVGPQLEGVLTDAFVGYLIRDHARYFFDAGDPTLGLRLTMFMLHARIREATLGLDFDPTPITFITDARRLAHGAGASGSVVVGGADRFLGTASDAATRARFVAQPSVSQAYERYLEWLGAQGYQTDVDLFTPASRDFLSRLPMTKGYSEYILMLEVGRRYVVETRDSLAILVFTSTPFLSPHFFRRGSAGGWRMDLGTEVRDTHEYVGGSLTWGFIDRGDDFARAFADRLVTVGAIVRLAGGDNRPLPVRAPAR